MKKSVKQLLSSFLVIIMLVGVVPFAGLGITASAAEIYSGTCGENLTWKLDTDTGELVISGTGEMYDFGYDTPWNSYRFSTTSITISDGVTSVGEWAFHDFEKITVMNFPNSVTTISSSAFSGCSELEEITLGKNISSIHENAFAWCYSLTSILIPESVSFIDSLAFQRCDSLERIDVDSDNEFYSSDADGVLYNKKKSEIIRFPIGSSKETFMIPESVSTICEHSFEHCTEIKNITIPDSVSNIEMHAFDSCINLSNAKISENITSIGDYAFYNCYNLTDFTIPDGVTYIGMHAFNDCDGLYSIIIPDSVTVIGNNAFDHCDNLSYVTISKNLTEISSETFARCSSLSSITIPNSVKNIGDSAFYWCDSLLEVTIGSGVENIGYLAFGHCVRIDKIVVSASNTNFSSDDFGVLYNDDMTEIIQYPLGNSRQRFLTPTSVVTVGEWSFSDCENLTNITLTEGVSLLGWGAFGGCIKLEEVTIPKSVTHIDSWCFDYCENLTDVYYKGTEREWNEIEIGEDNEPLLNATIHFLGESEHKHEFTHRTVVSTCTVAGMEYDICLDCGESFNVVTLPLASHSWSEWMTRTEATGSAEGEKYRLCSVCGKEETNSIPKLNVIEDKKTGIEIEFNDEYDSGVEIKVEEVFDGNSFELLEKTYGGVKSKVFDISTIKDGIKVQPDGKVKVRIPLPKGFGKNSVWVNYIDSSNGTVEKIPATVVNGYVEFETDHFSYYAIVEKLGKVKSVSIDDISMSYKDSVTITPNINVDAGVDYNVTYSSSNTDVVSIDANGKLTTNDKGSATITVTVTDEYGNTVTDTCKVNVSYKWWQWIIVIVLFGWIWY